MQKHEVASRRYGHALFDIAKAEGKIDIFLNELGEVSQILINNEDLSLFLEHPNITGEEKKKVINNVFKDKIDDEIIKLIFLLIDHDRAEEIRVVYYDYKYLVYKERGMKIAYVTTAVEMTDEEMESLRKKLCERYESEVEVQNIVKKDVIGGVYLKVGDNVIDGTVKGRLESMKKSLLRENGEVRI